MSNAISSITLCSVTITPTQQIDFNTTDEQKNYFASKAKHTYEKCKYQSRTGSIKVKGYVDTLQNCNYGYYTNSYNGTTKTFYFWIVAKNFLSRETTELIIQIDVFQTWLFDFNFSPCMIEREHVTNDSLGLHTIPEDFELGDYVTYLKKPIESLQGNPCYLIGVTDASNIGGAVFGKTYTGFELKYYKMGDYIELSNYIQSLAEAGKADAIAFIFSFPDDFLNAGMSDSFNSGETIPSFIGYCSVTEELTWNELIKNFNFKGDNYTPYNMKLYCYPYNFITVKNSTGGNVVLKLEQFENIDTMSFYVDGVLTQNPHITLTPSHYNGKDFAIDDSITMQDFPLCSWNNDNYANWYAQHVNTINSQSANAQTSYKASQDVAGNNFFNALDNIGTQAEKGAINTTLGTVGALAGGNFLGGASNAIGGSLNNYLDYMQGNKNAQNDLSNSGLMNTTNYQNSIRSIVASVKDASVQPNTCKGSTASSGLDLARGTATFFIEQTGIKPEYARIIDMYFQMFGYQVNSVKQPNFKSRTKWNYLKTVNASTFGDVPHADLEEINKIFNNGLTIWHNETFMYQFDTDNTIR
jgi:hypothetical protein